MNLFWAVYKNLEKELLILADVIHFDDKQSHVYSIRIADLLIRAATEIEAISKHLYEINGGNMNLIDDHGNPRSLYFDSDCIQDLDLKWGITKKVVNVVAPNFYFENEENRVLRPLKDSNKQGCCRWKKAYQAVKHNRVESLDAGNIGNLIRAMAALYLLNIYNSDEKIKDLDIDKTEYGANMGSDVFSVNVYKATVLMMDEHMNDNNIIRFGNEGREQSIEATVLIDKYSNDSFVEMHKDYLADLMITKKNFANSELIKRFIINHPEYSSRSINEICIACGEEKERKRLGLDLDAVLSGDSEEMVKKAGRDMLKSIISKKHSINVKRERELILNKKKPIYPSV